MRSCQAGWANCSCSLLTLMPFMARVLQLGARGDIAATAAAPLHTPARPRLVSLYSLPPHHLAFPSSPSPLPAPALAPAPPFPGDSGSPPACNGDLALLPTSSRRAPPFAASAPHFSSGNVPAVAACNPASKHRLCSHLLRNLVKLSALL